MATRNLFKDGALIDIHVCGWTGSIMLTAEDMGLKEDKVNEAFKLGRKMLIPDDVIAQFKSVENRARHASEFPYGLKFPIGSARFVPKYNMPKVIETLQQCNEEYNALADNLVAHYEEYKAAMLPSYREAAEVAFLQQEPIGVQEFSMEGREALKQDFIDRFLNRISSAYPSVQAVRAKFSLDWAIYEIAEPMEEYAAEEWRTQARQKIGQFVDDVVGQLRSETVNVCNRIATSIKEGKVIRSSSIDSLRSFVDKFKSLNFVGDARIDEQLTQLKNEFLDTHTHEQLSEPDMQAQLKRRLTEIVEVASDVSDVSSISGTYRRKISWED